MQSQRARAHYARQLTVQTNLQTAHSRWHTRMTLGSICTGRHFAENGKLSCPVCPCIVVVQSTCSPAYRAEASQLCCSSGHSSIADSDGSLGPGAAAAIRGLNRGNTQSRQLKEQGTAQLGGINPLANAIDMGSPVAAQLVAGKVMN